MTELSDQTQLLKPQKKVPAWVVILSLVILLGFLAFLAAGMKSSDSAPITVGDTVPDFTFTSFSGETYQLSDLRGKVVLINFWASWCGTCEEEAAALEEVWREYSPSGEVIFLGVDYVDTEPEAKAYLDRFDITYPNGPDLRTAISQIFRVTGVPETYILGKNGRVASLKIGSFSSSDEIRQQLEAALSE